MVTVDEARRHLERRWEQRRAREATEAARLEALLLPLRDALVQLGARRVWLFGSLAEGRFHDGSDVDLATEGLDERLQLRAMAVCAELAHTHVDVVLVEDAPPTLRERILSTGRLLT